MAIDKIQRRSSSGAVQADELSKAQFLKSREVAAAAQWRLDLDPARVPAALLEWINNPRVDDGLGHRIWCELNKETPVMSYNCSLLCVQEIYVGNKLAVATFIREMVRLGV